MVFSNNKRKIIFYLVLGLLSVIMLFVIFKRLHFFNVINDFFQIFLGFELSLVVKLFNKLGFNYMLNGNIVFINTYNYISFDIQYLLKKWTVFLFLMIWLTPAIFNKKIYASLIVLPLYFFVVTCNLFSIVYLCDLGFSQEDARSLGIAVSVFMYLIFILLWIRRNPEIFTKLARYFKIDLDYIKRKYNVLITFLFLLTAVELILGLFEFRPWITFLFTTSQKIINLYHYNSIVESFYLLGDWGNIYMAKGCLGIRTMFLFAMFIFLTGENVKRKILFISIGVILINIANILRFVYLFIFIQNHNVSELRYDIHDVFNVVVYAIVFVLIIIWLEWFTDIWPYIKTKSKTISK